MERRKDTPFEGTNLPRDYLKLVEDVFNKNFSKSLLVEKGKREFFVVYGEIYPDELLLVISLKNPTNLRMTTCYASVDYPPPAAKPESENQSSVSEAVQLAVNQCVDAVAGFFATYFEDDRPMDYDVEYRQGWTAVEIDKTTRVHMRINRDNPELESEADEILKNDEDTKKKHRLH